MVQRGGVALGAARRDVAAAESDGVAVAAVETSGGRSDDVVKSVADVNSVELLGDESKFVHGQSRALCKEIS